MALKAFDAMSTDSNRYYLWKAAMEKADANLVNFGQALYGELRSQNDSDQKALGRVLIDALAAEPAHAASAAALQRWQADPNTAARALVKHSGDLRALAVAATGWQDQKAQRIQLEELAHTRVGQVALKAFDAMSTDSNRYYLWKAAMEKADANLADFGQALYGDLRHQNDSDQKALGRVLIEALAGEPAHATAAAALQRWRSEPNLGARALVKHSGDLRALAVAATPWNDRDSQRAQLGELSSGPGGQLALALFDRVTDESACYSVWKEILESTDRPPGEFALALLGRSELREQASFITQTLLQQTATSAPLGEQAGLARQVIRKAGRQPGVVQVLIDHLAGRPEMPPSMAAQLKGHSVKPDVETLERLLAEIERIAAAEEEVRKLASEMKAPSTGIAVEEDRVLVGGVVVKNRGS